MIRALVSAVAVAAALAPTAAAQPTPVHKQPSATSVHQRSAVDDWSHVAHANATNAQYADAVIPDVSFFGLTNGPALAATVEGGPAWVDGDYWCHDGSVLAIQSFLYPVAPGLQELALPAKNWNCGVYAQAEAFNGGSVTIDLYRR